MTRVDTGIEGVELIELKKFNDRRGWLAECYRRDETQHRPAMGYVSVTEPGVARGPHEHHDQTDLFVFTGPGEFQVYLYDARDASATAHKHFETTLGTSRPASLLVPPGVIHAYRCVSDHPGMILNLPDQLYAGEGKKEPVDEIRHEDKDDSPFYKAFDRSLFVGDA